MKEDFLKFIPLKKQNFNQIYDPIIECHLGQDSESPIIFTNVKYDYRLKNRSDRIIYF